MATKYEFWDTGADGETYAYKALWKAQTFTPSVDHEITKVVLKVRREGSIGTVTVSIRATSGGLPIPPDLCSCSMAGSSILTSSAWVIFNMSADGTVAAGNTYAIVVRTSVGGTGNRLYWTTKAAGGYAGGQVCASSDYGASWTAPWTWDFYFEEWGNPSIIEKTSSDSGAGSESSYFPLKEMFVSQSGSGRDARHLSYGSKGARFAENVLDISLLCGTGSWTQINLSSYVPYNASMAILRVTGGDAAVHGFRARKPGGTAAAIINSFATTSHAWCFAPILSQIIEVQRDDSSVNVFLDGWVYGGDWDGLNEPVEITGLTGDTWNTIFSEAYCLGAKAIIFEYFSDGWNWDVRPYGSTWASGHQGGYGHGWGIIGCDSQQRWQIYPNLFGGVVKLDIAVIGYITGDNCEFFTDTPVITPASQGTYLEKDVQSEFSHSFQMSIIRVHAVMGAQDYDFRPIGSTRDWRRAHDNLKWAVVKNILGSLSFEQYAQHVSQINTLIGGYGLPPKYVGNVATDLVQATFI